MDHRCRPEFVRHDSYRRSDPQQLNRPEKSSLVPVLGCRNKHVSSIIVQCNHANYELLPASESRYMLNHSLGKTESDALESAHAGPAAAPIPFSPVLIGIARTQKRTAEDSSNI